MGLFTALKGQKAYNQQSKGNIEEARKLYEEAIAEGLNTPQHLLAYSILLLRSGEYQKARELLVKTQKLPNLSADHRVQLFTNYAAAVFRLGELDKGIDILEKQHRHAPKSLVYETLGYLYVEKYSVEPDFAALDAAAAAKAAKAAEEAAAALAAAEAAGEAVVPPATSIQEEAPLSAREQWEAGKAAAMAFLDEAIDYDDEDAVCLDNKAQFLYRVLRDKEGAKPWFDKAIKIKEGQIDTLYFLSRYDLEQGNKAAAKAKLEKALEGRFSPLNYVNKASLEEELRKL